MEYPPPKEGTPPDHVTVGGRKYNCDAGNTQSLNSQSTAPGKVSREVADDYAGEVARLSHRWRVVVCKDNIQWILQRRDAGNPHSARWRGVSYCVTRAALIHLCGSLEEACDPKTMRILATLPDRFGRTTK